MYILGNILKYLIPCFESLGLLKLTILKFYCKLHVTPHPTQIKSADMRIILQLIVDRWLAGRNTVVNHWLKIYSKHIQHMTVTMFLRIWSSRRSLNYSNKLNSTNSCLSGNCIWRFIQKYRNDATIESYLRRQNLFLITI